MNEAVARMPIRRNSLVSSGMSSVGDRIPRAASDAGLGVAGLGAAAT